MIIPPVSVADTGRRVFDDAEPVIQSHPLLTDAVVPAFGNTTRWDLNGVIRRPANLPASGWKLTFTDVLAEPYWNVLAREFCMIQFNPRHPVVIESGLSLRPRPANPTTVILGLSRLRRLQRWASDHTMPPLSAWGDPEIRHFLQTLKSEVGQSSIVSHLSTLTALHQFQDLLSCGGLRVDPRHGTSARKAANIEKSAGLATRVIVPEQWFPLIRAAWTYVHTFAPDILRAQRRYAELTAIADATANDYDDRVRAWLASPTNRIAVHPPRDPSTTGGDLHGRLFALFLGLPAKKGGHVLFGRDAAAGRRRRELVTRALAAGHPTTTGVIDDLTEVTRPDGSTGPWHPGLDPFSIHREAMRLRNACFTLVVGLSMMRDSEIHEITKGSLVDYYGAPAIASTLQKHQPGLPSKHWWIIEPVAQAIAVAEHLSPHPERVFAPLSLGVREAVHGDRMLDAFIAHVNACRAWTGLDEIPEGAVRPHMFRKTMAMLTDQFAGSEIALGIQLKHVATRALANRTTQSYAAADTSWAQHLESAIDAARFRRLRDLYATHKQGRPIGYGPAAERMAKVFDRIQQTVKARNGDATVERTLLRKARISIRFGTLNHCAFDENNPAGAVCLENAITPPGHKGPLPDRCRPDRCANSIIAPEHLPIWATHKNTLLALLDTPTLPPGREATLRRELGEVDAVLRKAGRSSDKEPT